MKQLHGRITNIRKLGGLIFFAIAQEHPVMVSKGSPAYEQAKQLCVESNVVVEAIPPTEEEKNYVATNISIISEPECFPTSYLTHLMESREGLKQRAALVQALRQNAWSEGFTEYETPILAEPTKEGARLFTVEGTEYALPQSPQLYKQLLMVAGYEKYFQIARCFRHESKRSNRQPEFTQFCLEKTMTSVEELIEIAKKIVGSALPTPPKFVEKTYNEALTLYGTTEPNLGQGTILVLTEIPMFKEKTSKPNHHPFTAGESFEFIWCGQEVGGGSIRPHTYEAQMSILQQMGYSEEEAWAHFGELLCALEYGALPHGGFAFGIERLLACSNNAQSIKGYMTFAK